MKNVLENIIYQYKMIQNGHIWIGQNYKKKLSLVPDNQHFTRPIKEMHSVAEIISHLSLWRKEAVLKIETGIGSKTDDCEENWLPNETLKKKGWSSIKDEYDQSLIQMIAALKNKDDQFLSQQYYDTDFKGYYPYNFLLTGILHHDIYHLGQLGIIIKYLNLNNNIK